MRIGLFPVMAGRRAGGPETYERNLFRALAALGSDDEYHIFCLHRGAVEALRVPADNVRCHLLKPGVRWISIPFSLPLEMNRAKIDLFHATFIPPPFSPVPYVFTLHDISMFLFRDFYPPLIRLRLTRMIEKGVRKARKVLCISEHARRSTIEYFGIPEERTEVVYHGLDPRFAPVPRDEAARRLEARYGIQPPYILFVGKFERRKNLPALLEAYSRLLRMSDSYSDVRLVLAGQRVWTKGDIDADIERLGIRSRIVEPGYVSEEDLPALYSAAEMFVMPSHWEGFGLPLLEAMGCGTPVISSNACCLPEIVGDAGILVEPTAPDAMAAAMRDLLCDGAMRESFRAKGFARAAQFTWEETARRTLDLYRKAAQ